MAAALWGLAVILLAAAAAAAPDEESIMRKLRQSLHESEATIVALWPGWQLDNNAHHCAWSQEHIQCNKRQHVTKLILSKASQGPDVGCHRMAAARDTLAPAVAASGRGQGTLLPELAQLHWLEELHIIRCTALPGSIPAEWGLPEAFPRLRVLILKVPAIGGGALIDIHPGALPALEQLDIGIETLHGTLPASWGSSARVLPTLKDLSVAMQIASPLPAAWANGFHRLERLEVHRPFDEPFYGAGDAELFSFRQNKICGKIHMIPSTQGVYTLSLSQLQQAAPARPAGAHSAVLPRQPPLRLPPEWASGFPNLTLMILTNLGLTGALPSQWLRGGFQKLSQLALSDNALTGTLPERMFHDLPVLKTLLLRANQFEGQLPEAWGHTQVEYINVEGNQLSGPAFPPSWLFPGAMPHLLGLLITSNPGLGGSLPSNLSWPNLQILKLAGTQVTGSLPDTWCQAPFADGLQLLLIKQTPINPAVPPCYMKALQDLQMDVCPTGAPHSQQHQDQVAIDMVVLAALVATCAAFRILWRRKLARQQRQREQLMKPEPDVESLLPGRHSWRDAHPSCGRDATGPVAGGGVPLGGVARRARLSALLTAELNSSQCCVEMVPLVAHPTAVVHQLEPHSELPDDDGLLGSVSRTIGTSPSTTGAAVSAAAAPGGQLGSAPGRRAAWNSWSAGWSAGTSLYNSSSSSDGSSAAAEQVGSRRWGLSSSSLQLRPGELEFALDVAGRPKEIGSGAYAVVYLARLWGHDVAVKVFELQPCMASSRLWQEASLLRQCTHDRVVPLYGVAVKGQLLMFAMKLMRGGSLRAALQLPHLQEQLRWEARGHQIAIDVAEALVFLHTNLGVMHGDIKASNVLLSEDMRASIADLGLAVVLGSSARTAIGYSRYYAAPEQLMGQRCTLAADMYSFGISLIELTTFQLGTQRGDWRLPYVPQECPQGVLDLIRACLTPDPMRRPTAVEALQRLRAEAAQPSA